VLVVRGVQLKSRARLERGVKQAVYISVAPKCLPVLPAAVIELQ
jgi:hypothetical protein